jgi:hypothetical protein
MGKCDTVRWNSWILRLILNYLVPGFLTVGWFGSSPTPSSPPLPLSSCLSFSVFLCVAGYSSYKSYPDSNYSRTSSRAVARKNAPNPPLRKVHRGKREAVSKIISIWLFISWRKLKGRAGNAGLCVFQGVYTVHRPPPPFFNIDRGGSFKELSLAS